VALGRYNSSNEHRYTAAHRERCIAILVLGTQHAPKDLVIAPKFRRTPPRRDG
jgi:hypothetical protein